MLLAIPVTFACAQISTGCESRTIAVNVLDHEGNIVADVKPAEFRAEFHGRPLEILSSSKSSAPRRVMVLVDLSGSLLRVEGVVHWLAENVMNSPPEELQLALVLFSDHVIDSVDFSGSREHMNRLLTKLPPASGRTALFDTLIYATNMFGQPLPGDSIYLISDGGDNASKSRREDVETKLLATGIRVFAFNPGKSEPTNDEEETNVAAYMLRDLTGLTGATVPILKVEPFEKQMVSVLQRSYRQTAEFYELHLQLPAEPITKPLRWDLQVVDAQGKKRKGVHVIYPRELAPCVSKESHPTN
jgi:VWA domain containing CoxE-like protein